MSSSDFLTSFMDGSRVKVDVKSMDETMNPFKLMYIWNMRIICFLFMLYFSLLSLAPNWQGVQLLNASAFIEHYEDHQLESKDASIFSFIKEHYFNELDFINRKYLSLGAHELLSTQNKEK